MVVNRGLVFNMIKSTRELHQIQEKAYAQTLIGKGVPQNHIRSYGFAFQGKKVLIGETKG